MAEQPPNELTVPKVDAGAAFRLEMWAANLFLGYWWVAVVAAVALLVGAAIYGFWLSSYSSAQRSASAEIAAVVEGVEKDLVDIERIQALIHERIDPSAGAQVMVMDRGRRPTVPPVQLVPLEAALEEFKKPDADAKARLATAGDELMAIAARSSGAAAANAAALAGEFYRLAESPESQKKAWDAARASGIAVFAYSADAAQAAALAEAGDIAAADALLRPWIAEEKGYQGQRAAYELGILHAAAGDIGNAEATWNELRTTWPASPLLDDVDERLEKLGKSKPPAAPTAPTEGTVTPEGPGGGTPAPPVPGTGG